MGAYMTLRRTGFVFAALSLVSIFQTSYADPPLPTPVGRVVWIKGALQAQQPNKETRNLVKMSVLYLHDILITDAKSQAEIVFTDNTLITFYPSSKMSIDKYVYKKKPENGSAGSEVTNLIEGGFRTITGLIAKTNNSDYQVNTPVATIGVRGTDYAVRLQNGHLYAAWYTGKPCLTSKPADKNQKGTELCLDSTNQYGEVPGAGQAPIPVNSLPDALAEKLQVTQMKIAPFGTNTKVIYKGGTITSFCITQ